jgi:integrase
MPKRAKFLSALEVGRLKHSGKGNRMVAVGGVSGLHLQITASGARTWILRTIVGERRREIGLGGFPDVALAVARQEAQRIKSSVKVDGVDPVEERRAKRQALIQAQRQSRDMTFAQAVEACFSAKAPEFKNDKHKLQWRSTLDTYAIPKLGELPVKDITIKEIEAVLRPIWNTKTETASRLRGRIEAVMSWAKAAKHREGENPARWRDNLQPLFASPKKLIKSRKENHPAVALGDAAIWFACLRRMDGMAPRALEFAAMNASRSGEVREATWDEVDLQARLWTIPAARMKAGRKHRVPLSADAVALLESLDRQQSSPYVFPAARGGPLSDMALSAVMRRMQASEVEAGRTGFLDSETRRPAVPHGLRSTFRDWVKERTSYPRELSELALAHRIGDEAEQSYSRGEMVEKRRRMMADWQRFLRGETGAKVVKLARAS